MNHNHTTDNREPTDDELARLMDHEMEAASALMDRLLPLFDEWDETHGEFSDVAHSLWIILTGYLAINGWEPDQLARDAAFFAARATTEGNA